MGDLVLHVAELTADNVEAVLAVAPLPEQLRYVNPVAWYVAKAAYEDIWHPVGLVSDGGEVVGFAQWAYDESDSSYTLGAVILDAPRQGHGLGRAAVDALVRHVWAQPRNGSVVLTVHDDNQRAREVYRRYGFEETGEILDGELVMVLRED